MTQQIIMPPARIVVALVAALSMAFTAGCADTGPSQEQNNEFEIRAMIASDREAMHAMDERLGRIENQLQEMNHSGAAQAATGDTGGTPAAAAGPPAGSSHPDTVPVAASTMNLPLGAPPASGAAPGAPPSDAGGPSGGAVAPGGNVPSDAAAGAAASSVNPAPGTDTGTTTIASAPGPAPGAAPPSDEESADTTGNASPPSDEGAPEGGTPGATAETGNSEAPPAAGSTPPDNAESAPNGEASAPGDEGNAPSGGEATAPGGDEASAPAGGEATAAAGGEATAPAGGEASAPAGDEASAPAGGEATAPAGGEAGTPGGGEAKPPGGEEIASVPPSTPPENAPAAAAAPRWPADLARELQSPSNAKGGAGKLYVSGLDAMKNRDYPAAVQRFDTIQKKYPHSDLTEPAAYFSANALNEMGKYDQAILQYNDLVMRYPKGKYASESLLREAQAFVQINDKIDARLTLQKLSSEHPGTPQAATADAMMKSMESN